MEHVLTPGCGKQDCTGCPRCNTRSCTLCGLPDAALTTDCCGKEVTATATGKICEGKLDYRVMPVEGGVWVNAMCPAQQEVEKIRQRNRNAVKGGHAGEFY
jgi:hypothetical protein